MKHEYMMVAIYSFHSQLICIRDKIICKGGESKLKQLYETED